MTHYFSWLSEDQVEMLVDALCEASFGSKRDGCRVVIVRCAKCARQFEEEIEAAKKRVRSWDDFLCLECDPDAAKPGFVGLTVQIGWEAE